MKKKTVSIILCIILIFSFTSVGFANELEASIDKNHEKMLNTAVSEYFRIKENTVNNACKLSQTISEAKLLKMDDTNDTLSKNIEVEMNSKDRLESYYGISVMNVEVESEVRDIQLIDNSAREDEYSVKAYEWTWVDYASDESGVIDRMGYGIEHDMVFRVSDTEAPVLLENNYYDNDILGERYPETRRVEINSDFTEEISANDLKAVTLDRSNLDINKLVAYADSYVRHTIGPSPGGYYSDYNSDYEYFPNNDCANYVSQCLRAGGLPDDHTLPSTWWHDGTNSTNSWRFVSNMIDYFTGEGLTKLTITSNYSNVYPGNPVITADEGHVAVCVGYNHAGTPLINGHTRDVYHQPIVRNSTNGYYYTFKVFTSDYMVGNPGNATQIFPSSTYKSISATSIPANQSLFYKIKSTSNDTLSIKFGNSISGRKMFCVLYEAHHGDMDLYEVDSFDTTSLQEYTAPITGTSSSPKWYYLRFYHYWSSPQTLNFSYKIS